MDCRKHLKKLTLGWRISSYLLFDLKLLGSYNSPFDIVESQLEL
jgi:hypothetical protein